MIRKTEGNVYITEFMNITELVHFIETNKPYKELKKYDINGGYFSSTKTTSNYIQNVRTNNFEEAKDLLLHGWEHGTKEIKAKVEAKETGIATKQKSVYDAVGYQASVPRYLQGIPTNMVNKVNMKQKNKVITINKFASYTWSTKPQVIINESVKVLQLINRLEKQGYRVNLNVVFGTEAINKTITKVRIKSSSQRLNIKQVAFPLVHPSMLRRIIFAVWERLEENNNDKFKWSYGIVMSENEIKQYINKGEYIIPETIYEKEITNIDKYKVI